VKISDQYVIPKKSYESPKLPKMDLFSCIEGVCVRVRVGVRVWVRMSVRVSYHIVQRVQKEAIMPHVHGFR